jgi:hypothetical protein
MQVAHALDWTSNISILPLLLSFGLILPAFLASQNFGLIVGRPTANTAFLA